MSKGNGTDTTTALSYGAHIRGQYERALLEGLPSSISIEDFTAIYDVGLGDGQIIGDARLQVEREQAEALGFNRGKAQGLAYAAYAASHVSTIDIHAAMSPSDAATQMRDNIVVALELARNLAITRAQG
jgi:hypothetical protein